MEPWTIKLAFPWYANRVPIQEEPYQLRLFGKDTNQLEVITADFLPDGKQLYIVVADADCNIQILQFDPERTFCVVVRASYPC